MSVTLYDTPAEACTEPALGGSRSNVTQWNDANPSGATSVCGKQGSMNRIVGGDNSQAGEWPWQVSLMRNGKHHCGGSLIRDQWIVTASHCFQPTDKPANFSVLLGALKLSDPGPHSITVAVRRIVRNPTYEGDLRTGDIALVELEHPVKFTHRIVPICLPDASVIFPPGHKCWVTGWGDVQSGEEHQTSDILQKLEVPIISTNTCNALYHQDSGEPQGTRDIKSDMICAGFAAGRQDACHGDSGGPLVCLMDDSWLQAGVVSWGEGCAQKNRPGVYARLTYYESWIHSIIPELKFTAVGTKGQRQTVINRSFNSASAASFQLTSTILSVVLLLLSSE
ncbi:serine protease 27-like [Tiliqua scincoides]|uniref:serine protease 27-like n=1 Tax=Tiliqua scincoides TaxID=71010 RepID=UPI003462E75E